MFYDLRMEPCVCWLNPILTSRSLELGWVTVRKLEVNPLQGWVELPSGADHYSDCQHIYEENKSLARGQEIDGRVGVPDLVSGLRRGSASLPLDQRRPYR